MEIAEWRDFPTGAPGYVDWWSALQAEGWVIDEPFSVVDDQGVPVLRHPVRRAY